MLKLPVITLSMKPRYLSDKRKVSLKTWHLKKRLLSVCFKIFLLRSLVSVRLSTT